ncbi:DNA adenine methylase [Helicobacter bizzozeronii]|uniref:DNA adenine methylase n=1 Tax=Helicobacter bizzozeronii TaxID=56877 RepID=UPI0025535962|nr:DNA adenine methylase [Helicobacter bizzozeronii]
MVLGGGGSVPHLASKRIYFEAIARLTHRDFYKESKRLQRVIFANKDFEDFIKTYDTPQTFFYCDPPYIGSADIYDDIGGNNAFILADHARLANTLKNIEGKFLLSINDHPLALELYSGFNIEQTKTTYGMRAGLSAMGVQELLISNYGGTKTLFG